MGSNESFPPPPPPGQPGMQPTQQVPTTQAYPQQGYVPAASAPKKGNGLLIGGGLAVAAVVAGGIFLLTGGDDDKTTSITLAPITSTTVVTTTPATAVITTPPTVPATEAPTVPTTADSGLIEVFDDTGTFSMVLPNDLETDTTTITSTDGFIVPSISAADGITAYNGDDTTFGLTAVAVGPDIGSDAAQVMAFLEPPEGTCTGSRSTEIGRPTALGAASVVTLTGCGVGAGNKVLMVVALADRPIVVGIYMQGLATIDLLLPAAQFALESIVAF